MKRSLNLITLVILVSLTPQNGHTKNDDITIPFVTGYRVTTKQNEKAPPQTIKIPVGAVYSLSPSDWGIRGQTAMVPGIGGSTNNQVGITNGIVEKIVPIIAKVSASAIKKAIKSVRDGVCEPVKPGRIKLILSISGEGEASTIVVGGSTSAGATLEIEIDC